jgi:hypothetical protein
VASFVSRGEGKEGQGRGKQPEEGKEGVRKEGASRKRTIVLLRALCDVYPKEDL